MKRIGNLGLVALAALAIGALSAAPASAASKFSQPQGLYQLDLEGVGQKAHTFLFDTLLVECTGPTFNGIISGPSSTLSATVKDSTCSIPLFGQKNVPFKSNGCKFTFLPEDFQGWDYAGRFNIGPPGCGPMAIEITGCKITIPAHGGLKARYTNVTGGATDQINVAAEASGMTYTRSGLCGGNGTFTNGGWGGDWLITGKSVEGGLARDVQLVEAEASPRLEAESFPVTMSGEQNAEDPLTFRVEGKSGPKLECKSIGLSGSAGAQVFSLKANPKECAYSGSGLSFPMTVAMNSCEYAMSVTSVSSASVGVKCSNPEDSIKYQIGAANYCEVKVGPQAMAGSATLANTKSGTVVTDWNLSSIKYTVTKHYFLCPMKTASYENGELFGEATLAGKTGGGTSQFIWMRE